MPSTKQEAAEYYLRNKEDIKRKTREYRAANRELVRKRERERYLKNKEAKREYHRQYRASRKKECAARAAVSHEVRMGRMVAPDTCSKCGCEAKLDGHHEDYDRPLDVIWLCRPCHVSHHACTNAGG